MPDYRQGNVRGGQQFAGVSRFLNLKRIFEDAKRQHQWKLENEVISQRGERTQQAATMASLGTLPGADLNKFVESGRFPESFQGGQGMMGGIDPNMSIQDSMSQAGIPLEQQQDYRITPQTYTWRGKQKIISKLERKKDISQKTIGDITQMDNTHEVLNKNMNILQEKGIMSGPGIVTLGGPTADIAAQYLRSPEFVTWKASTQRAFQLYRKWATGVAAGYPELQLLAPNYPKSTDKPDVFISKSFDVMKDIEKNRNILIKNLNKGGYATSAYGELDEGQTQQSNQVGKYTYQ